MSRLSNSLCASAAAAALLGSCGGGGGDGPTPPSPPVASVAASITAVTATTLTGTVGQAVGEAPSVVVRDQSGTPLAGTTVAFSVTSGGGTVATGSAVSNGSGVASSGSWTLGTTTGTNTVSATAGSLPPVTFTATAAPGAAATLTKTAGDEQSAEPGAAVSVAPTVVVKDQFGNPVPGTVVTFAPSTGGSVTGGTATSTAAGEARVGSWTLGPTAGPNTLTASAGSLPPVTFTANAGSTTLTAISPALLLPGASATLTGSNFSTTPAVNSVTVDGVPATVTAATTTQLTITVPPSLPCGVTRDAPVRVTVSGAVASRSHPIQPGKQRSLAVGQSLVIPATELRCNELAVAGGRYYLSVYNTSRTYSPSGVPFELNGTSATTSASIASARSPSPSRTSVTRGPAATRSALRADIRGERLHLRLLEENARILRENRSRLRTRRGGARFAADPVAPPNVGDLRAIRIPDLNAPGTSLSNVCNTFLEVTARVAYVGSRSIILEDTTNTLARQIDTTYAAVGAEFDNSMFGILQTNFGNPLVMDAGTDNNGRVVMVFSNKVNTSFTGIAGFVVACDFFARDATFTQSNFGEYFYAIAPTTSGNFSTPPSQGSSPPNWLRSMRSTIIHEVKHVTSLGERTSRGAPYESSWLEESTARISEELYARSIYGLGQKVNIPYGSSSNPVGPYCEVRPTTAACAGYPVAAHKHFQSLARGFYPSPGDHSPIGRRDSDDFSFYNTGWSLVRWAIDHGAASESAFLRGLIQEPSMTGVTNLEARAGRTFAEMLAEWSLAMVVDDYPGFTPANPRLAMPSWNFRSFFAGLNADFPTTFPNPFPLVPITRPFGNFTTTASSYPGTTSIIDLNGTLVGRQSIELKASGSSLNAPAELGLAVVRVQ